MARGEKKHGPLAASCGPIGDFTDIKNCEEGHAFDP